MSGDSTRLTIVRHADAGSRSSFDGPDADRPLTARGRAQAEALTAVLGGAPTVAIVSSPARRCVETVTPFAQEKGMEIETIDALSEESTADAAVAALVAHCAGPDGVVVGSTHGPIFEELLRTVAPRPGTGRHLDVEKAGRIEMTVTDGSIVDLEVFAAPKVAR